MKSPHEMYADKMGGDDGEDDVDDSDYGDSYKDAVKSFIDAVHAKDPDAAAAALESAVSLCSKMKGDEPDGDEGSGGHSAMLLIPHGK